MMISIGDLAQVFSNRMHNARIRSELNTLADELTTGRKSDLRSALAGDVAPVSMLERTLSNLAAFGTATSEATLFAASAQSSLQQVGAQLDALTDAAFALENTTDTVLIEGFGTNAASRFEAIVGALNTSVSGRSLFAGAATGGPPIDEAGLILDDIMALLPANPSVQDVSDTVDTYFAPGGDFETTRYLGSDTPLAAFRLSPDDSASFSLDARDPALGEAMAAAAKGALIDRGLFANQPAAQNALVREVAQDLLSASGRITAVRGDIGTLEERIETAKTRNSAEAAATNIALAELVVADPYDTATELQAVQTQLETFFSVTARLSQLTLAGYLR